MSHGALAHFPFACLYRSGTVSFHEVAFDLNKLGLKLNWTKTKTQNLGTGRPASDLADNGEIVAGRPIEEFTQPTSAQR